MEQAWLLESLFLPNHRADTVLVKRKPAEVEHTSDGDGQQQAEPLLPAPGKALLDDAGLPLRVILPVIG